MEFTIVKHNGALNGFNQWTLNDEAFSMETMKPMYKVHEGRRYRLKFRNASDDIHPLHLHRHSFELTRVGGKPTAGVIKDVVMLGGFQEIEFDFVADNPGRRCSTAISSCTWILDSWRCSTTRDAWTSPPKERLPPARHGSPLERLISGGRRCSVVLRSHQMALAVFSDLIRPHFVRSRHRCCFWRMKDADTLDEYL